MQRLRPQIRYYKVVTNPRLSGPRKQGCNLKYANLVNNLKFLHYKIVNPALSGHAGIDSLIIN